MMIGNHINIFIIQSIIFVDKRVILILIKFFKDCTVMSVIKKKK